MKKLLFIILGILFLFALAFFFLFRGNDVLPNTPGGGLPFGSPEGVNIPATQTPDIGATSSFDENVTSETPIFRLSNTPTAGFAVFARGNAAIVRYVDRATGHIFDVTLPSVGNSAELERSRVTNTTLPKIYEAHFRNDGNAVLLRSLENESDSIRNTSLALTPPRSTSTDALYTIAATNLRGEIDSVLPGTGDTLYYVLKENSTVATSNFAGNNLRNLFVSRFDQWRLGRLGNNLLLYTKASALTPGFAYSLPAGGGLTKIVGPLNGLAATANPAGTRLLYSYYENGTTKLFTRNLQSGATTNILPATLAEKCVWSTRTPTIFFCGTPLSGVAGTEPDNWYLGRTHFSDYIWRFDTASEIAQLMAQPKTDFDLDLDLSELKLSPDERYLIFINKRDLTLWALKLAEA